jgi:hypothetical protein
VDSPWRRGAVAAVVAMAVACGNSDDSGGTTGGNDTSGDGSGCCSINSATYTCPNATALKACSASDPDPIGCTQTASCGSNNTVSTSNGCGLNDNFYDCPSDSTEMACILKSDPSGCSSRTTACPD